MSHAHRVVFIDLARAMAVVMMVYGHTTSALLAADYQVGLWFDVWLFQRGLTSALFLLLSGFAFAIATSRHWAAQTQWSGAVVRRLRRFTVFIIIGYALHLPVKRLITLPAATEAQWRSFLQVDVLQLIGVTFLLLQALVMLTRSRRRFAWLVAGLAAVIVAVAPVMWRTTWTGRVPYWLGAYFSPGNGSLFPFFPWSAYIMLGAAAGMLYARWGAADLRRYANRVLLVPGAALFVPLLLTWWADIQVFGHAPFDWVRWQFLIRTGAVFLILGVVAHLSRRIDRLPSPVSAVAQESLTIYVVHLWIVYGTIWGPGLVRSYGGALDPWGTLLAIACVLGAMILLAMAWHQLKHIRPRLARWATAGIATVLIAALL